MSEGLIPLWLVSYHLSYIHIPPHACPVFPEMKTVLRSYHPIPSLQKTEANLQDAPRIKNCLKACLLPRELSNPPSHPADILANGVSWSRGSYSVYTFDMPIANGVHTDYQHRQPDFRALKPLRCASLPILNA